MKKVYLIALMLFFYIGSQAQKTEPVNNVDKLVSFTNADYDMGKIPSHKPLEYNVTIKNISKETVVLKEVKAGCGCTTPKYRSNEKILPGKSTYITLGFNGDATGPFEKVVDIYFNDGSAFKQLKFRGNAVADSSAVNTSLPSMNK